MNPKENILGHNYPAYQRDITEKNLGKIKILLGVIDFICLEQSLIRNENKKQR